MRIIKITYVWDSFLIRKKMQYSFSEIELKHKNDSNTEFYKQSKNIFKNTHKCFNARSRSTLICLWMQLTNIRVVEQRAANSDKANNHCNCN